MKYIAILSILLFSLFIPRSVLQASESIADTTYQFLFELNMTKTIQDGLFDPDSDQVFVDFDENIPDLLLMTSSYNIYNGIILQGLDSGVTYHFRFRINDTLFESINREAVALPGTTAIRTWWNDEYLNTTTFRMDASGFSFYYFFSPETDFIEITGDMNQWQPTPLERIGTSLVYEITCHLDPQLTYAYLFRINGDTLIEENLGGVTRLFRPPDTTITVPQYFSNQDTGKIAMTFSCHMEIQQALGHFNPDSDYLDVAGNFNEWGAWDLLYDYYQNGIYQVVMLFDKNLIGGPPLEFKFRINGSWETAELQGLDPRSYVLKPMDTSGNPNVYECWYDNREPGTPSPPWVTDLYIQGNLAAKRTLTGSYLYHNINGIPEGNSLYRWYRADSVGAILVPIDSAWYINYTLDSVEDVGKYIVFEVTPVAAYGDSATGQPARVYTTSPIGGVGIPEYARARIRVFPNPAEVFLVCESNHQIERLEVINLTGILVYRLDNIRENKIRINTSGLPPGLYLMRVYNDKQVAVTARFVKR